MNVRGVRTDPCDTPPAGPWEEKPAQQATAVNSVRGFGRVSSVGTLGCRQGEPVNALVSAQDVIIVSKTARLFASSAAEVGDVALLLTATPTEGKVRGVEQRDRPEDFICTR